MRYFVRVRVLLCWLSAFALLPSVPAGAGLYSGGLGTMDNPYVLALPEDLQSLALNVRNGLLKTDVHYVQSEDIDMAGVSWLHPIGEEGSPFEGHYDGQGFAIRNLRIADAGNSCVGLFGCVQNAVVRNVVLEESSVRSNTSAPLPKLPSRKRLCVGALAGEIRDSTIFNCTNSGDVYGGGAGNGGASYTGGLIGCAAGPKTRIIACRNGGLVTGGSAVTGAPNTVSYSFAGGVVGGSLDESDVSGIVQYCINEACIDGGNVSGGTKNYPAYACAGGVIGFAGMPIESCGNAGMVVSGSSTPGAHAYTGGIVGHLKSASLAASWSDAAVVHNTSGGGVRRTGGLIGNADKATLLSRCFYLQSGDLRGVANVLGDLSFAVALSEEDFTTPDTFPDWNASPASAWFCEGGASPKLKHFYVAPVPSVFVFSEDVKGEMPFALSPAHEGFAVCDADCGDGFSITPGVLPYEGILRFDGGDFRGEKELRIAWSMEGLETSSKILVRTVSVLPAPDPDPPFPPDPEPPVPPNPDPPVPPEPVPPIPPDSTPEVIVPAQTEPAYAEGHFVELAFPIRTVKETEITGLCIDRYPVDWDSGLTAAFEGDTLKVSGNPTRSGRYVLEVRGRSDGVPFKIDVTVTILPHREVLPDAEPDDPEPSGEEGCNGGWGIPGLLFSMFLLSGRMRR